MRRFIPLTFAFAVAAVGACGSGGSARTSGAGGGPGAGGAPSGMFAPVDAGGADQLPDASPVFSCAAAVDGGTTCIQFDPDYPDPAGACAAQQAGAVVDAPCSSDGSAGGCHVAAGTSGYTIWSYGEQTAGALFILCQQRGESYVSPDFDVTVDAAAHAAGLGPSASQF